MVDEEKMKDLDAYWNEAIKPMQKYGFIVQAYGGVAVVMTHKNQLKMWGEEKYLYMQKEMHGNDMKALCND